LRADFRAPNRSSAMTTTDRPRSSGSMLREPVQDRLAHEESVARPLVWRLALACRRAPGRADHETQRVCCRQVAATPLLRAERDGSQRDRTATAFRASSAICLPRPRARSVFSKGRCRIRFSSAPL
jgi:hypothetical protein